MELLLWRHLTPYFYVTFFSALDSGLLKKAKDLLSYHGFDADLVKGVSQDYNKPLFIPAYSDSIQAIMGMTEDVGRINLDMWKHQYTTHFPQSVSKRASRTCIKTFHIRCMWYLAGLFLHSWTPVCTNLYSLFCIFSIL